MLNLHQIIKCGWNQILTKLLYLGIFTMIIHGYTMMRKLVRRECVFDNLKVIYLISIVFNKFI